jgi:uncharacterized protein
MSDPSDQLAKEAPRHGGVRKNAGLNRFELEVDGFTATAVFRIEDGSMNFTSTQCPPSLRNKGIATRLIQGALEIARDEKYKVIATCSFVANFLSRHPEFSDLTR